MLKKIKNFLKHSEHKKIVHLNPFSDCRQKKNKCVQIWVSMKQLARIFFGSIASKKIIIILIRWPRASLYI